MNRVCHTMSPITHLTREQPEVYTNQQSQPCGNQDQFARRPTGCRILFPFNRDIFQTWIREQREMDWSSQPGPTADTHRGTRNLLRTVQRCLRNGVGTSTPPLPLQNYTTADRRCTHCRLLLRRKRTNRKRLMLATKTTHKHSHLGLCRMLLTARHARIRCSRIFRTLRKRIRWEVGRVFQFENSACTQSCKNEGESCILFLIDFGVAMTAHSS